MITSKQFESFICNTIRYIHSMLILEHLFFCFFNFFFSYFCIRCTNILEVFYLQKVVTIFLLLSIFFYLLLFPLSALDASKTGLLLWFDTLLPTLLPFLILSQLILKTPVIDLFQKLFSPIFVNIFHCSSEGAFCALCGFLCGYPVGARLIALQIKEKRLTLEEGQYLLSFCNNVSPMFCISYGIHHAIGSKQILPYLFIVYGSALLFGIFTRPKSKMYQENSTKKQTPFVENIFQLIDVCIIDSFLIMIKLCGYLILFSIINSGLFLLISDKSIYIQSFLAIILEITNGLSLIGSLPSGILRTVLAVIALTFGGFCCIFQTNSVISESGLSLKKYTLHKCIITGFALFFYFVWHFFFNHHAANGWC